MRRNHIAYSSKQYLLYIEDVEKLSLASNYLPNADKTVILLGDKENNISDKLLSGRELLLQAKQRGDKYIPVVVAYPTFSAFLGFLIQCIKYFKRRTPLVGTNWYRTKLSHLLNLDITRGIRTRENAYQWNNPRWKISEEERIKRYNNLCNSLKKKGYNYNSPMLVAVNRHMGYKDQLLQGHHRIGICQELKIDDVSISFWAYPASPVLFGKKS